MANNSIITRIEYTGLHWLVWRGPVLMLTTSRPTEVIDATRGIFPEKSRQDGPKGHTETVEEFLARGGKIRKVKPTPNLFTDEEIEQALQAHFAEGSR